jgi:hypothetical protein
MTELSDHLQLRAPGLEWRSIEEEVIALDITASLYLAVNQSGKLLWEQLAGGTTRAALVQSLLDAYGLDRAAAEHDTDAFLAELAQRGLLDPSPNA